jgi:hypothetical protein
MMCGAVQGAFEGVDIPLAIGNENARPASQAAIGLINEFTKQMNQLTNPEPQVPSPTGQQSFPTLFPTRKQFFPGVILT